ncbi:hypothetical protein [Actinokineospora sp. HUAS TT18]|uniref:hypothetical protein n=1 Tax=Actinokineospora sp. HUAS TT18 TaxID=3447451 RepID=UPI003F51CB3A
MLLAELLSDDSNCRARAADSVCDWRSSYSVTERRVIVRMLSVLAQHESDLIVREAQLHAIFEVVDHPAVTLADVEPVFGLVGSATGSELEYLQYLHMHFQVC